MLSSVPARRVVIAVLALLVPCTGCDKSSPSPDEAASPAASSGAGLPPLNLRDDTKGLLLTWVDDSGDFHVGRQINEVPEASRSRVRVVVGEDRAGTGELFYVANLTKKSAAGTYEVTTLSRSAWDEIGAERRKSRMESLRPDEHAGAEPEPAAPKQEQTVVLYGASWCGACRQARAFLKNNGIKFLEKDVDESPEVKRELLAKLSKAGLPPTSSIPVIDVAGKILVGFSADAVRNALAANH